MELYNLVEDIGETHGLSQAMPENAAELSEMLRAWHSVVDARMPRLGPEQYLVEASGAHPIRVKLSGGFGLDGLDIGVFLCYCTASRNRAIGPERTKHS